MVIADADGSPEEAARVHAELTEVLGEDALASTPRPRPGRSARCGAGATARRWPSPRSAAARSRRTSSSRSTASNEAIDGTVEIGRRHDLEACSWGHAGDGNLHSTFMIDLDQPADLTRAEHAAEDLFALAVELGGSVSGEHGIGLVKNGQIARQWEPAAVAMHEAIKRAFDPKGLLNPGKKLGNGPTGMHTDT